MILNGEMIKLSSVLTMISTHANYVFTYANDYFEIKCLLFTNNHHVNFEMSHAYMYIYVGRVMFESVLFPVI